MQLRLNYDDLSAIIGKFYCKRFPQAKYKGLLIQFSMKKDDDFEAMVKSMTVTIDEQESKKDDKETSPNKV